MGRPAKIPRSPIDSDERTAITSSAFPCYQTGKSIPIPASSSASPADQSLQQPSLSTSSATLPCQKSQTNHPQNMGMFNKLGAIELENKGSVARDHLALERTFLAWLRTSLAFASIGIAVTQLFRLNSSSHKNIQTQPSALPFVNLQNLGKPLGATFLGIAILVLLLGSNRYYESQSWLLKGKFPASRGSVFLLTAVACALIVSSLVIVVLISPKAHEQ